MSDFEDDFTVFLIGGTPGPDSPPSLTLHSFFTLHITKYLMTTV